MLAKLPKHDFQRFLICCVDKLILKETSLKPTQLLYKHRSKVYKVYILSSEVDILYASRCVIANILSHTKTDWKEISGEYSLRRKKVNYHSTLPTGSDVVARLAVSNVLA